MHGTLIPIPSYKLTALPSTILSLQSLHLHLRKYKIVLEKRLVLLRGRCPIILLFFITAAANLSILFMGSNLTSKISLDLGCQIFLYSWNPMTKDLRFGCLSFIIRIRISIFCERFSMTFFVYFIRKVFCFATVFTETLRVLQCNSIITAHFAALCNSMCQFVYARAERGGGK